MKEIACLGTEHFLLGFRLAGIKRNILYNEKDISEQLGRIREDQDIGIVIIEQDIVERLDFHDRKLIEESIQPVFIPISTNQKSDNLRKLIIKSIGLDVLKGD